jgi:hypothetical protein
MSNKKGQRTNNIYKTLRSKLTNEFQEIYVVSAKFDSVGNIQSLYLALCCKYM